MNTCSRAVLNPYSPSPYCAVEAIRRAEAAGTRTPWIRDGATLSGRGPAGTAQCGAILAQSPSSRAKPGRVSTVYSP